MPISKLLTGGISTVAGIVGGIAIATPVATALSPVSSIANYEINKVAKITKVDPNQLVSLRHRNLITEAEYYGGMEFYGYAKNVAKQIFKISKVKLGATEYLTLWKRKLFSETESENDTALTGKLNAIGYGDNEQQELKKLTDYVPSVSDAILFAVREVFNTTLSQQLELSKDYPEDDAVLGTKFAELLRANGVDRDTGLNFWKSHWVLMPLNLGFEALHRFYPGDKKHWEPAVRELGLDPSKVEMDVEKIQNLIKTQDYAPGYHDSMVALSYSRILRVDTRRLIRFGMIDYSYTKYLNKANGNTEANADLLTKFSFVNENISKWRDEISSNTKTEEQILLEMTHWEIKTVGVQKNLQELNQRIIDAVKRELSIAQTKKLSADVEFTKSEIIQSYEYKNITKKEAKVMLEDLGYDRMEGAFLLANADVRITRKEQRTERTSSLSQAQVTKAFIKGLVDESRLRQELEKLGENKFSVNVQVGLAKKELDKDYKPSKILTAVEEVKAEVEEALG